MVRGYILLNLLPGFETNALSQIRIVPGVKEVTLVFGHWDTIVTAESDLNVWSIAISGVFSTGTTKGSGATGSLAPVAGSSARIQPPSAPGAESRCT